jgi:exodeoxyribonuclease VII small subunit
MSPSTPGTSLIPKQSGGGPVLSAEHAPTSQPPLPFEEALASLEEAVHELEEGQLDLNVALKRYEEGIRLLGHCYRLLEEAERKVELLSGVDADGEPITEHWRDQATTLEEKAESRSARRTASGPSGPPTKAGLASGEGDAADMDRTGKLF